VLSHHTDGMDYDRPDGVDDATVEALGKASEAFEYIERVRGHLFSAHQLMGHADFVFEEAAERLRAAGHDEVAGTFERDVVGRNLIDGRWTFQLVDEFDEVYYEPVRAIVREAEDRLIAGRRHVFESELKDARRTPGAAFHERRPPTSGDEQPG